MADVGAGGTGGSDRPRVMTEDMLSPQLIARASEANARDASKFLHILIHYGICVMSVGMTIANLIALIERSTAHSALMASSDGGTTPDADRLFARASGRECDRYFGWSLVCNIGLLLSSIVWSTQLITIVRHPRDGHIIGHRGIPVYEYCTIAHLVVGGVWLLISIDTPLWYASTYCELRSDLFHWNQFLAKYIIGLSLPLRIALADSAVPTSAREHYFGWLFNSCVPFPVMKCDDCTDTGVWYCTECISNPDKKKSIPTPLLASIAPLPPLSTTGITTDNSTPNSSGAVSSVKGRWLCQDHYRVHQKTVVHSITVAPAGVAVVVPPSGPIVLTARQYWTRRKQLAAAKLEDELREVEEETRVLTAELEARKLEHRLQQQQQQQQQRQSEDGEVQDPPSDGDGDGGDDSDDESDEKKSPLTTTTATTSTGGGGASSAHHKSD